MRWAPITSRALGVLSRATAGAQQAVWPVVCVFCGLRQRPAASICEGCSCDLPRAVDRCITLAPLSLAVAALEYAFPIDAAIKAMKFKRRLYYAPAFAELLMQGFTELPDDIDALVPMPLHWRRHAMRGFNQAAEIARPIGRKTGLPLVRNARRCRSTPFQSGLSSAQRKRNLEAAFSIKGEVAYRHVLIIDDVITTGATCRELAEVLLAAGAEKVSALAIAQAVRD